MPVIRLTTCISAPIKACFDISRDIDIHLESTKHTGETAIAGRTSGLIELHESVTWRAKHLGIWQTLTSKVTEMREPYFFADEMVAGAFRSFKHEHYFVEDGQHTIITDVFTFESPIGIIGKLADKLFLTRYMTELLVKRNAVIKEYAELRC